MATRMPWGAPTVSDATLLALRKTFKAGQVVAALPGESVYELLHPLQWSDVWNNLAAWTEADTGGNINLAANVVDLNGNAVANQNGIYLTAGLTRQPGYFEFKTQRVNFNVSGENLGALHSAAALVSSARGGWAHSNNNNKMQAYCTRQSGVEWTIAVTAATWYTLRMYIYPNAAGTWCVGYCTIQGGAEWPGETALLEEQQTFAIWTNPFFPQFQRWTNSAANLSYVKEPKFYGGYSVAGPTLTYVCDAGAGKIIDTFDLTNLAPIGGWVTTNATFAWSFDDGVAAYSAEHTLAAMNAHGVQAGRFRYARLRITVNSDGAVQQYAGEVNAADATLGIGDFPEVNNTYLQDTVQLVTGTLPDPVERPECLTTNILNVNQQAFTLGDTVYVNGTLEFVKALAAANVRVRVYNDAGVLQATLFNAAYNFLATTAVTLTAINGGVMLSHLPAAADGYYVEVVITHANLPNGSLTFFSGFGVAAAGGGGGATGIRVVDAEQLVIR